MSTVEVHTKSGGHAGTVSFRTSEARPDMCLLSVDDSDDAVCLAISLADLKNVILAALKQATAMEMQENLENNRRRD